MTELSFLDASAKLLIGSRVRFVRDYEGGGDFPVVPSGTTGTVTENNLNEIQPMLYIRSDSVYLTTRALPYGDADIQVAGPDSGEKWTGAEMSGLEVLDPAVDLNLSLANTFEGAAKAFRRLAEREGLE